MLLTAFPYGNRIAFHGIRSFSLINNDETIMENVGKDEFKKKHLFDLRGKQGQK